MFKAIIAATAVTAASASINADFMQGLQTGVFTTDPSDFEDFSCPEPEISDKVEQMLNMYNMAKNMFMPQLKSGSKKASVSVHYESQVNPQDLIEKLDKYANQIAIVASVMDANYEGGDFCAGLTIGFEGRQVGQRVVMELVQSVFKSNSNQ